MGLLESINRKYLITPKALYFFVNLQHYTLHKFRPLFAEGRFGISKGELGKGLGCLLFVTFFINIFIATMSDKLGRQKTFIVGLLLMSCVFFQLFYVDWYIGLTDSMFWVNLFAYLATNTAVPALLDKVVLDYLSRMPDVGAKTYGKQRIWGTAGYSLSTFAIEGVLSKYEGTDDYDFTNLKYYSMVVTAVAVALVVLFVGQPRGKGSTSRRDMMAGWRELLTNGEYLFFIFIIFLNGLTRAGMTIYLSVYTKDVLNVRPYVLPESWPRAARWMVGIFNNFPLSTISVFEAILEITILFYAQTVTDRIGYFWPLLLAQVAQLVRFVSYLLLPYNNPHVFVFCCVFELLKGINFGLTHGSGVQLAARMCPPHLKATSQMIYTGTFTAIGSVAAGVIFGCMFGEGKEASVEEMARSFRVFFGYNVVIAGMTVVLFFYKYGIRDGVLFNAHKKRKRMGRETVGEKIVAK